MPLILAIEPDGRQASALASLARHPLDAEIVVADSAERSLEALGARVPDLILTSALLSPQDESTLAEWLRRLDAAAAHVQTLTIPVLATSTRRARASGGVLKRLRRSRTNHAAPDACDPALFAEQIAQYLERAEQERAAAAEQNRNAANVEDPPPAAPDAPAPQEPIAPAVFERVATLPEPAAEPIDDPGLHALMDLLARAPEDDPAVEGVEDELGTGTSEPLLAIAALGDVDAEETPAIVAEPLSTEPVEAEEIDSVSATREEPSAVSMDAWSPDPVEAAITEPIGVETIEPTAVPAAESIDTVGTEPIEPLSLQTEIAASECRAPAVAASLAPVVEGIADAAPVEAHVPIAATLAADIDGDDDWVLVEGLTAGDDATPGERLPEDPTEPEPPETFELIAADPEVIDGVVADPPEPAAGAPADQILIDVEMTPSAEGAAYDAMALDAPDLTFSIDLSDAEIAAALDQFTGSTAPSRLPAPEAPAPAPDPGFDQLAMDELELAFDPHDSWEAALPPYATTWPSLDGVAAEAFSDAAAGVEEAPAVADAMAGSADVALAPVDDVPSVVEVAVPATTKVQQGEQTASWLDALELLRLEIERLRIERAAPVVITVPSAPLPVVVAPPHAPEPPARPPKRRAKPSKRPRQPPPARQNTRRAHKKSEKPVQDEWGFFDPEQCGFAALLAKLDEVTEGEETPSERGSRPRR